MLEDIQVFCSIAKHQSFAKASRELGISTPVVTRRLARLEESLNTRLLNRTTRQVSLTEAGNLFYAEVVDILHALEATKESVKSLTYQVSGTLKVGLPLSFSNIHVSNSLSQFISQYPHLKLHIHAGYNQLHLLNQGFDLVIHCGEIPDSTFHYRKLGSMKKILCGSPSYFEKNGIPRTHEDLHAHNCLAHTDGYAWQFLINGKIQEVMINGNIHVNNILDLKNLAVEGVGIVCLPYYFVNKELRSGSLIPILDQYALWNYPLYAVYPSHKFMTKKMILFIKFITDLLVKITGSNEINCQINREQ